MQKDQAVYILGEDILDPYGGAFKVSKGLSTQFPDRVITTPISEAGIVGIANGMALRGLKPIVEIMFGDFITLTADQLVNYAAKFSAMYQQNMPGALILRVPVGAGRGYGPTHSQSLEKMFLGIPHLQIIAPSHFHDPGEILAKTAQAHHDPVLFLEHKLLYTQTLLAPGQQNIFHISWTEGIQPTAIIRNYESYLAPDVTLIAYGGASLWVEKVMETMAREEIRVLACLPSQIQPLDMQPLIASIQESHRLILIEEGTGAWGWSAEVAARIEQALWGQLQAPIRRLASLNTIVPAAKPLEEFYLPSVEKIEQAIYEVLL
jgi:pyruvate/2-oxoglutarate/acetoin dehydrogenase E1 component